MALGDLPLFVPLGVQEIIVFVPNLYVGYPGFQGFKDFGLLNTFL